MKKRTTLLAIIAMMAIVLVAGCEASNTDEQGPGTDATTAPVADTSAPSDDGATTTPDTKPPVCQKKADGNCTVPPDVTDPPVEDIGEPTGCELVTWLIDRQEPAEQVECTSPEGASGTCNLQLYEEDGVCMVSCDPGFTKPANELFPSEDNIGFSYETAIGTIQCTIL